MNTKHVLLRFGACLVLLLGDRLFAELAVATNAAGALLSPSGAVPLTSFAIALGFLGCRLGFVLALAGTVAWTTADAVRSMLSARDAS